MVVKRPSSSICFLKMLLESRDHTISPRKPVAGPCQNGVTGFPTYDICTCTRTVKTAIDLNMYLYLVITPRTCARGKVIGRVVVVVSTKIAISRDIGV